MLVGVVLVFDGAVEGVEYSVAEVLADEVEVVFLAEGEVVDLVGEVDGLDADGVEDLVEDVAVGVGGDVEVA